MMDIAIKKLLHCDCSSERCTFKEADALLNQLVGAVKSYVQAYDAATGTVYVIEEMRKALEAANEAGYE